MSLIWVFLDGVGLGPNDPEINPWSRINGNSLIACEGKPPSVNDSVWRPLDATLGIKGLPQSATGTTALLTGVNASQSIGRHLSGFPHKDLRDIIDDYSVHKQFTDNGLKSTFANAYNEAYFKRPMSMQSVTTHCVRAAGLPFRMMDEYRYGKAVFHDLTGEMIRAQGNDDKLSAPGSVLARKASTTFASEDTFAGLMKQLKIPIITSEEGADRVVNLADEYDLVLFEYVKTDLAGHMQDMEWAESVVDEVMRFLLRIVERKNPTRDTLLIASDHGNSEDLSTKSHTTNPVPAVAVGPHAHRILDGCTSITDLVPSIINSLSTK